MKCHECGRTVGWVAEGKESVTYETAEGTVRLCSTRCDEKFIKARARRKPRVDLPEQPQ